MTSLFKWLGNLGVFNGTLLFAFICLILALAPYIRLLYKIFLIWRKKEKAEIRTFEYDISVDHKLKDSKGYSIYLLPQDQGFLVNGGKLLLTWNVVGAYRVDLDGVGRDLKGNGAWVIINRDKTTYLMTIHTLQGKKTKLLQIPKDKIIDVKTTAFTNQNSWNFNPSFRDIKTYSFTRNGRSDFQFIKAYPKVDIGFPIIPSLRPKINRLEYVPVNKGVTRNYLLNNYIESQEVLKIYPYERSIYQQNGTHLFFDTKRKVRDFLKTEYANK